MENNTAITISLLERACMLLFIKTDIYFMHYTVCAKWSLAMVGLSYRCNKSARDCVCLYCSQCIVLTDSGRSRDISLSGYMIKDLMKCVISPCVYQITQKLRKTGSKLGNSNSGVLTWFTWLMPSCFLWSFVVVSSLDSNGWSMSEDIILKGYIQSLIMLRSRIYSFIIVPHGPKIGSGRKMIILVSLPLWPFALTDVSRCIFLITGSQQIINLSLLLKK